MILGKDLIEGLLAQARQSDRLRQNYDLRTSPEDTSQRMLNAVLPGTQVPIHRHSGTTECVVILKGRLDEVFYDAQGREYERIRLDAGDEYARACVVPKGVWHTIEVHLPSVILEAKDGPYVPQGPEDVLKLQ